MIAWLAARSDPPNYGRLIVFNFPKQKLVYGPRQIDARIDQDPVISQQLSLWNQRGSQVIRGSLLAIPIDQSLIYVQPLYLAAVRAGGAARAAPRDRRVRQPDRDGADARAVAGAHLHAVCVRRRRRAAAAPRAAAPAPATPSPAARSLGQRAWEIWGRAQDALRRGDWAHVRRRAEAARRSPCGRLSEGAKP